MEVNPFLHLFSVGTYVTARLLMARMELGLTRDIGNFLFDL